MVEGSDVDVPMLARMFDRRCRGYEAIGYTVLLPASAIHGWPTDVTLPADPVWKRDYSASVRRLIRDGGVSLQAPGVASRDQRAIRADAATADPEGRYGEGGAHLHSSCGVIETMRPARISTTVSARAAASSRSCVTYTMVTCSSRRS